MKVRQPLGERKLFPRGAVAFAVAVLLMVAALYLSGRSVTTNHQREDGRAVAAAPTASVKPADVATPGAPRRDDNAADVTPSLPTFTHSAGPDTASGAGVAAQVRTGEGARELAPPPVFIFDPPRPTSLDASDSLDDPLDDDPQYDGVIAGRVMDDAGQPVPDVELTASAMRLFDADEESQRRTAREVRYAVTDFEGAYAFSDLAEGEYRIKTTPMGPYASAQKSVRTGAQRADLLLSWHQDVTVFGAVRSRTGAPLDGVRVMGFGSPPVVTHTDPQGQYELTVGMKAKSAHLAVHFRRTGYREQRLKAPVAEADAELAEVQLDATLDPASALTTVRGTVKDTKGRAVAGQMVTLTSPSVKRGFNGVSDARGSFVIKGVEAADDYRVLVAVKGPYRDYRESRIKVPARGAIVDVVLEPLAMGRLEGRMVNFEGVPVPNFSLTLKSQTAIRYSQQVTGDAQGRFVVTDIPEGAVQLRTQSSPRFSISGLRASPEPDKPALVMLDVGDHALRGWVVDDVGEPVAAAKINVRMQHTEHGVRSFSARDAIADAEGYFELSGFGAGVHTVRVTASEFSSIEFDTDLGMDDPELVVELDKE